MLEREKTFTIRGREFAFRCPTFMEETAIQTETLRRMTGILNLTPDYYNLYDTHYAHICMERLITKAPESWYESIEGQNGQKDKRLRIDKFYENDEEFKEVRKTLVEFLRSFRGREESSEAVPKGNGKSEVAGTEEVSPTPPVHDVRPDFGRGAENH